MEHIAWVIAYGPYAKLWSFVIKITYLGMAKNQVKAILDTAMYTTGNYIRCFFNMKNHKIEFGLNLNVGIHSLKNLNFSKV